MENVNPNLLHTVAAQHGAGALKPLAKTPAARDRPAAGERRPRVLLFTEKAEEVFLLEPTDAAELGTRRKLADAVLADPYTPRVWWDLLKHVQAVFGSDPAYRPRIHKLFLKATRVIPEQLHNDDPSYTSIWIGFALAERDNSPKDCREAFQHMSRMGIGRSHADLYCAWAMFEHSCGRTSDAVSVLHRGMEANAQPSEALQSCLARLRNPSTPAQPQGHAQTAAAAPATYGNGVVSLGSGGALSTPSPPGQREDATQSLAVPDSPSNHTAAITLRTDASALRGRGLLSSVKRPRQPQLVLGALDLTTSSSSSSGSPIGAAGGGETMAFEASSSSSASSDPHNHTGRITMRTPAADTPTVATAPSTSTSPADDDDEGYTGKIQFPNLQQKPPPAASSSSDVTMPAPRTAAAPPTDSRRSASPAARASDPAAPAKASTTSRRWHSASGLLGHGRAARVRASATTATPTDTTTTSSSAAAQQTPSSSRDATPPLVAGGPHLHQHLTPITEDPHPSASASLSITRPRSPPVDRKLSFPTAPTPSASSEAALPGSSRGSFGSRVPSLPPTGSSAHAESAHAPGPYSTSAAAALDKTWPNAAAPPHHPPPRDDDLSLTSSAATRDRGRPPPTDLSSHRHHHHHDDGIEPTTNTSSRSKPTASSGEAAPSERLSFSSLLSGKTLVSLNGVEYLRLDVLGKGGSSKVFRVLAENGQVLALKRVRVSVGDQRALESFANEITLLSRLRGHPSIIQLVDSCVDPRSGVVLMLMELGETDLNKLLQQQQQLGGDAQLSFNFIRYTWEQMLHAVQCVHEERIVHGDLKPANFVFVRGRLKLIDFGIAKAIANDTTNIMRENQVGTVNYMSPEAILDTGAGAEHPVTGRKAPCMKMGRQSDVWSLGCILYQMVYRKTPFADLSLIHKLQAITDDSYAIPFPPLPPPLQDLSVTDAIQRCLQRDPSSRATLPDLFSHPFLTGTNTTPAAASSSDSSVQEVVRATLAVLDRDRDVLQISPPATRLATLTRRVTGELARAPLSSPPPSSRPPHPELRPSAAPAPAPTAAPPSYNLRAAAPDLSEQIRSQRSKLRPVTEAEREKMRQQRPARSGGGPMGLYTMLEQDLQHKFRHAHNRDNDTNGSSSTQDNTSTWSFC